MREARIRKEWRRGVVISATMRDLVRVRKLRPRKGVLELLTD